MRPRTRRSSNCLVAARPAERLDGTMQDAFPLDEVRAARARARRMSDSALRDEVVELAQALIRIDTSNPPGNETPAAELLAEHLRGAGADCELLGPDPARLNLVAQGSAAAGRDPR